MLKGIPAINNIKQIDKTDKTAIDRTAIDNIAHLHSAYYADPAFDLFPIDYRYKLSENGESMKMHWFDDKFRFLMKF